MFVRYLSSSSVVCLEFLYDFAKIRSSCWAWGNWLRNLLWLMVLIESLGHDTEVLYFVIRHQSLFVAFQKFLLVDFYWIKDPCFIEQRVILAFKELFQVLNVLSVHLTHMYICKSDVGFCYQVGTEILWLPMKRLTHFKLGEL